MQPKKNRGFDHGFCNIYSNIITTGSIPCKHKIIIIKKFLHFQTHYHLSFITTVIIITIQVNAIIFNTLNFFIILYGLILNDRWRE